MHLSPRLRLNLFIGFTALAIVLVLFTDPASLDAVAKTSSSTATGYLHTIIYVLLGKWGLVAFLSLMLVLALRYKRKQKHATG